MSNEDGMLEDLAAIVHGPFAKEHGAHSSAFASNLIYMQTHRTVHGADSCMEHIYYCCKNGSAA